MTESKKRVIHIHDDPKFIDSLFRFEGEIFENTVLYIKGDKPYSGRYKKEALVYDLEKLNFDEIVAICDSYDLVVLYRLDYVKCRIAVRLSSKVKIAWRLFGTELYRRNYNDYLSDRTIEAIKVRFSIKKIKEYLKITIKSNPKLHKIISKKQRIIEEEFQSACNRIDLLIGVCSEEYNFLKTKFQYLPKLVMISIHRQKSNVSLAQMYNEKKILPKPRVIIGHRKCCVNNHLDILDIVEKRLNNSESKCSFDILFSYGREDKYSNLIRSIASQRSHYNLIETFMSESDFSLYYMQTSAFVLNGYRQMAVANILTGIRTGVKIYLNKVNTVYDWLVNEGFIIFSINDFEKDIVTGNIALTIEQMTHNINALDRLCKNRNTQQFQSEVLSIL